MDGGGPQRRRSVCPTEIKNRVGVAETQRHKKDRVDGAKGKYVIDSAPSEI